jgi:hypothetical protein
LPPPTSLPQDALAAFADQAKKTSESAVRRKEAAEAAELARKQHRGKIEHDRGVANLSNLTMEQKRKVLGI